MPSTGLRPKADLASRVRAALERAEVVAAERSSALTARDPAKLKALGKEHARLEPIVRSGRRYVKLSADLAAAREMADGSEPELWRWRARKSTRSSRSWRPWRRS